MLRQGGDHYFSDFEVGVAATSVGAGERSKKLALLRNLLLKKRVLERREGNKPAVARLSGLQHFVNRL